MSEKIRLVAILGPTASGKTGTAVYTAKRLNGEIISADSMQIYKELSIGTAKPTAEEMEDIKHHLVDFKSIYDEYSVADYVNDARKAIDDVCQNGKLPIICGGTGLYVDSLLTGTEFAEIKTDFAVRNELYKFADEHGNEALHKMLEEIDPEIAEKIHFNNVGRVVRAIEVYKSTGKKMSELQKNSRIAESPYDVCYIGIGFRNRETLYSRIEKRIDEMLKMGIENEAKYLFEHRNIGTVSQAIGYKEFYPYFKGEMSFEEAVDTLKKETRHYAKRQLTWFCRNKNINWIYVDDYDTKEEFYSKIIETINKHWSTE